MSLPAARRLVAILLSGVLAALAGPLVVPRADARPLPSEHRPAVTVGHPAVVDPPVFLATPHETPGHGVWPLDPRPDVVARFDPPSTRFGAGHRGVDLLGRPGQPVRAALAGRVSFAGVIAGRGVVVVDHGTTRTTYEPVHATVHVGDEVTTGHVIGRLQTGGSHCFPRTCLHWGLIEGAEHYLDPLTLVGLGPVRLLPISG